MADCNPAQDESKTIENMIINKFLIKTIFDYSVKI
jgi:hypothetical protein